jgi:16S rRNA (uracil1498-N3)-methyltransferase
MAKTTARLFVDQNLSAGAEIALSSEQSHYLSNVLRIAAGDSVHIFNGRDGEYLAHVAQVLKRSVVLRCESLRADAKPPPDIDYLFAPLKHQRLDYLVQKATELGAKRLRPVITSRTIAERVNFDRMRANVVEAAEQCNLVYVPEVLEPQSLNQVIREWAKGRALIYCDEVAAEADPLLALQALKLPAAILVGPEGGFTIEERSMLKALPYVTALNLGPRIMRADTAAVAVLALVQAVLGDWHKP